LPFRSQSNLISTLSSTSKALTAARARARKLRDELDEVRREREAVRRKAAAREGR